MVNLKKPVSPKEQIARDLILLHAAWAEYLKAENGDMTELNRCTDIAKVATDICSESIANSFDSANSPEKDPFLTSNASVSTNVEPVAPQNNERVWTPQVSVRNSLNMSFTSEGGIIEATFQDGSRVILGS